MWKEIAKNEKSYWKIVVLPFLAWWSEVMNLQLCWRPNNDARKRANTSLNILCIFCHPTYNLTNTKVAGVGERLWLRWRGYCGGLALCSTLGGLSSGAIVPFKGLLTPHRNHLSRHLGCPAQTLSTATRHSIEP